MILPTKHIGPSNSILGVGAIVLSCLGNGRTVSQLWNEVRHHPGLELFPRFILTLDFLYSIGAIDFSEGIVRESRS